MTFCIPRFLRGESCYYPYPYPSRIRRSYLCFVRFQSCTGKCSRRTGIWSALPILPSTPQNNVWSTAQIGAGKSHDGQNERKLFWNKRNWTSCWNIYRLPKLWSVSFSCFKDKTNSAEVAVFQRNRKGHKRSKIIKWTWENLSLEEKES